MPTENLTAKMSFDQGLNCMERQDFDTAADHFKNAVDTDPRYEEAHEQLATAYEKLGYAHRAKKAWEQLGKIASSPKYKAMAQAKLERK